MLFGGTPPDLLMTWAGNRMNHLIESGNISPIDDLWASKKMDEQYSAQVSKLLSHKGHYYAVPVSQHYFPIWYNKHIFKKFNLTKPKTWKELLHIADVLSSNDIIPFSLGAEFRWPAQYWFDYLLMSTAGYEYRDKLVSGKAKFTDPQVVNVFHQWGKMIEKGYFNKDAHKIDWLEAALMLYNGEAAMNLMGTYTIEYFENRGWIAGKDFDFFVFPVMDPHIEKATISSFDVILQTTQGIKKGSNTAMEHFNGTLSQMVLSEVSGGLSASAAVPLGFYPPVQQDIIESYASHKIQALGFDLDTEFSTSELGLSAFKALVKHPENYRDILINLQSEIDKNQMESDAIIEKR